MLSAPPRQPYKELPNFSWSDQDNVRNVKAAIQQMEFGVLHAAALLVDQMRRDDRVSGCLDRRTQALPALPFHLEAADDSTAAKKALEALEPEFESVFPDGAVGELQLWEVMLGLGCGQLLWEEREGLWWPRLKVWHPRYFLWRWDTRAWHVNTLTEASVLVTPGDSQWVLHAGHNLDRAYMWGASRYLYVPWLLRQWALRDWGRWSEVYGSPVRLAHTPAAADEADKQRFLDEVTQLGAESSIRLPTSADPTQKFDVTLLEAKSTGSDGFEALVSKAEASIAIALLGQNLTTEVKGGSYSAAQVHNTIRGEILQGDAERLARTLREQVLKPWAAFNFGNEELAPKLCWNTEPPEDKVQTGLALKGLGEGISALKLAGGFPDVDELMERAGVPAVQPAKTPEAEAQEAEAEAKAAQEAAKQAPGGLGKPPGQPPKLSALGATLTPSGAMKGQLYADALTEAGRDAGLRLLQPEAAKLLLAVSHAKDWEDLKAQLVAAFGTMEPDALAVLLQRAMVMAELAGRVSVLDDIGR